MPWEPDQPTRDDRMTRWLLVASILGTVLVALTGCGSGSSLDGYASGPGANGHVTMGMPF